MRKTLALLFVSALAFVACSGQRDATEQASKPEAPQVDPPRTANDGPTTTDSVVFRLERTPCFGACKAYRIVVYRSGYAVFEGRANMEKMGPHNGRIGSDTLATIARMAQEKGFFEMADKYDADVTDLPTTYLRIVTAGKDKQVQARVGQPAAFKELVSNIEGLLLPVAWKPTPPAN